MEQREREKSFSLDFLNWRLKNLLRVFICGCFAASYFYPQAINILLAGNLIVASSIFLLRFKLLPEAKNFSKLYLLESDDKPRPFVSVHIPLNGEKPELVLETLESLQNVDYPNFEVIVSCQAGVNEMSWKPVQKFCRKRNSLFKFKSVAGLKDGRAGALNDCLSRSNPVTKFVMALSPEFRVSPCILKKGVGRLEEEGRDFLQFPKIWAHGASDSNYLEIERSLFYQIFIRANEQDDCVLLTGSLSLVRKDALIEVGGWRHHSSAEETRTSLELIKAGRRGAYEHSLVCQGAMPKDLTTMRQERNKWVFENAQALFSLSPRDFARMGKKKSGAVLLQLTAWHDFMFVPLAFFCLHALDLFMAKNYFISPWGAEAVAGATILGSLYFKLLFFLQKLSATLPTRKILGVYFAHFGLALESNLGWVASLSGRARAFIVTSLAFWGRNGKDSNIAAITPHAALAIAGTLVSSLLFEKSKEMAAVTPFMTGAITMIGAVMIHFELKRKNKKT